MIFFEVYIALKAIYILLMTDVIFNYGISSCFGYQTPKTNSSSSPGNHNFLQTYSMSILNKSRTLEEAIFSDVINNIKSLLKEEKKQSEGLLSKEKTNKKNEIKGGKEKKCRAQNSGGTESISSVSCNKSDVFLTGENDFKNKGGSEYVITNLTAVDFGRIAENDYLLGYSGNPFGGRKGMTEIVRIPEGESLKEVMDPRKKRSVLHLYNMVLCTTGCNPFSYKGYGCYCGFLGSGFVVDGIDSCCKMHDWCYNSAGCPMFLEYFIPYLWKCYHHQPLCAIDHGYYGGPSSCAQRLCECDRQLALCLRRYPCPTTKALCTSSPWRLLQNILML